MAPYPEELEHIHRFGEVQLWIRPLRAGDEALLIEFFRSHSPETIYNRYFNQKKTLTRTEARARVDLDYEQEMALGAIDRPREQPERLLGVGRYFLNPATMEGETALVVHEQYRRLGISRHLTEQLAAYAQAQGLRGFYSDVLPSNNSNLELHRRLGHRVVWDPAEGIFHVHNPFP